MKKIALLTFVFAFLAIGGMPAAHGLMGKEWGEAVRGLAQMYPGAVSEHIRG
jgi:hypothetical protein